MGIKEMITDHKSSNFVALKIYIEQSGESACQS